jgi:acyl-CoA dehydrogenase
MAATLQPVLAADALVEGAANRAFTDIAAAWFEGEAASGGRPGDRAALLGKVVGLGFADALASPEARESWAAAAAIIRAQARSAAPIDMALLLATGNREASIAGDPERYDCAAPAASLEPQAAAALALGRCLQICAALQAAMELSLRYVQDRRQFGRPLAKFQAIQHTLAIAAEETAASGALTELALACAAREGCAGARLPALLDAAALVLGRAVEVVYDASHQVHGAIGFTREYALHRHSLNLLRWRDDLQRLRGGELPAAERLGDAALAARGVWRAVTALMQPGEPHD